MVAACCCWWHLAAWTPLWRPSRYPPAPAGACWGDPLSVAHLCCSAATSHPPPTPSMPATLRQIILFRAHHCKSLRKTGKAAPQMRFPASPLSSPHAVIFARITRQERGFAQGADTDHQDAAAPAAVQDVTSVMARKFGMGIRQMDGCCCPAQRSPCFFFEGAQPAHDPRPNAS